MRLVTLVLSFVFLQTTRARDLHLDYHWSHSLYAPYICTSRDGGGSP